MRVLVADAILVLHFLFVLFVTGGLLLIWIGAWRGWSWVRNPAFRIAHLIAIAYVAGESLAGMACPLTEWEDALRGAASDKSFIARWIHRLMFFALPEWVFTVIYTVFATVIVATLWFIPPRRGTRTK
jgi:hypothetical protein